MSEFDLLVAAKEYIEATEVARHDGTMGVMEIALRGKMPKLYFDICDRLKVICFDDIQPLNNLNND